MRHMIGSLLYKHSTKLFGIQVPGAVLPSLHTSQFHSTRSPVVLMFSIFVSEKQTHPSVLRLFSNFFFSPPEALDRLRNAGWTRCLSVCTQVTPREHVQGAYARLYKRLLQFSTNRIHHATAWRRAPLEKLKIAQPVKEFPAVCGNGRFITLLSRAHQRSLYCALWIQSTHAHPISLRTTFILSPIYVCAFQVVSFVHAFPPKGPDNLVGITTTLSRLDNQGLLFRFPSDARDFSFLPSVQAGSGAHPVIQ